MALVASSNLSTGAAFLQELLAPMTQDLKCEHTCGQPYVVDLVQQTRAKMTDSWMVCWAAYCPNPVCMLQSPVLPGSYVPCAVAIPMNALEKANYDQLTELIMNYVKKSVGVLRAELAKFAPRSPVCGSEHMAKISDWLTNHLREVGETTARAAEQAAWPQQDFTSSELFDAASRLGFISAAGSVKLRLPPDHPWA